MTELYRWLDLELRLDWLPSPCQGYLLALVAPFSTVLLRSNIAGDVNKTVTTLVLSLVRPLMTWASKPFSKSLLIDIVNNLLSTNFWMSQNWFYNTKGRLVTWYPPVSINRFFVVKSFPQNWFKPFDWPLWCKREFPIFDDSSCYSFQLCGWPIKDVEIAWMYIWPPQLRY